MLILGVALLLICVHPAMAKDRGYLIVHVSPPETYIYADGQPVVESNRHYIILTPGDHQIAMYNYGYKPEIRTVTIREHKWWNIRVDMQPIPGMITGPWGCITLEGAPRASVLLNGTDPAAFFVGHGDEFNNEWGWHQELVVPPGKHVLTVQYLDNDPWTTNVDVQANQRVVVDAYKGVRKTVAWGRGDQLKELPRFHAGIASARVAVEKVGGNFSASTGQLNCGDSAHLVWSSTGASTVALNGAVVDASGDQIIQPKENTNYHFTASGPGGVYTSDASVNVNNAVTASLNVSPDEVRYNSAGEKVGTGTPSVTWTSANADSVSIDPLGSVATNGSQPLQLTAPTAPGVQTVAYTLHATNACGGSTTQTANLQVTGPDQVLQGEANLPAVESAPTPAPVEAAALELPTTASTLPLVGVIGLLSLGASVVLLLVSKRVV
jgi:hypothetical protein